MTQPPVLILTLNIDWPLFHKQKLTLVALAADPYQTPEVIEHLDGVISLLDAIQDALEPENPETASSENPEEVTKP